MDTNASITLDLAFEDESLASALVAVTEPYASITYRVVALHGPGGGWPVVKFVGALAEITALATDYCAGDEREALTLIDAA